MFRPVAALLAVAILSLPLAAQAPAEAGLGARLAPVTDVDGSTLNNGHVGVTYVPLTNTLLVSSRAFPIVAGGAHSFYEFTLPTATAPATLLNTYQQVGTYSAAVVAGTPNGPWGHRDLTTDLGLNVFGGDETGVYAYDASAGFTQVTGTLTWLANNGAVTSTVSWPLPLPGGLAIVRALAFNPAGNGGQGSLLTANFGSAITEFDINGVVLRTIPFNNVWSIYGMTIDARTGNLWVNSSPNAGDLAEIDLVTGLETGARIVRSFPGTAQGGLSIIEGPAAQAAFGVPAALIGLDQGGAGAGGANDGLSIYRLHRYAGVNGGDEFRLLTEFSAQGLPPTGIRTSNGGTFTSPASWQLEVRDPTGLQGPTAVTVLAGIGPDAITNGNTFGIPELVQVNNSSVPASLGLTFVLADGLGVAPFLGTSLPLVSPLTGVVSPVLPTPALAPAGTPLRFQAVVLDARGGALPIIPTNTISYTYQVPQGLFGGRVEAEGPNAFNAVTTSGFFKVINTNPVGTGPSIVAVEFDVAASSSAAIRAMVFNYNQTGMADQFMFGNGGGTACRGTFRNGSDVTCGLVYDNMNTFGGTATAAPVRAITCNINALSGWSTRTDNGASATANGGTCRDFRFRFAPGTFVGGLTFEFDVDTDLGPGLTGDTHAGIVISITYDNGSTAVGELRVDPARPQLASITL